MSLILGIVRVLIILLIIRIVVHWIYGRRKITPRRPRTVPERAGGTLVRDPHCGTFVPEALAISAGAQKFCSTACRDAWAAAHRQPAGTRN